MNTKANDVALVPELHGAARNMLWVIGELGAANSNGDFVNWRDYLEPILVDAYSQLDEALNGCTGRN